VYNKLRLDLKEIFEDSTGLKAFPFTNDFLYWEENGTIDTELARNLIVAAGVVFIIVMTLIPRPRIALVVGAGIMMSMVELLGFMHWWGVTINGTSTIYLLICLGLAVDYSAHIAHVFNISEGSMESRSLEALSRIGPSVFHALTSTILAVIALGFSKSYVFVVFFKILFLATMIAGFKGLWLLPVVLSLVGGSKSVPSDLKMVSIEPTIVGSEAEEEKIPTEQPPLSLAELAAPQGPSQRDAHSQTRRCPMRLCP
jgi:predicted RND superfamily exporter protein